MRIDLEADEAVLALGGIEYAAELIRGLLHILLTQVFVDSGGIETLTGELLDLPVVGGALRDRLLEDGRVGSHARQRVL